MPLSEWRRSRQALLDKLEAEAELKVKDELNVVLPMKERERIPILADPNNCMSTLHYTIDDVCGHLLVEPEGGILIFLTSGFVKKFHDIEKEEENKAK